MRRREFLITGLSTSLVVPRVASSAVTVPSATVLELFTSQGCSSCPPADALLGELSQRRDIIALAWHVDYWNGLGWRDPYARAEYTERQKFYARTLHEDVYTPALVVNGAAIIVGSNREAVRLAIAKAPPPAVAVTLRRQTGGLEAAIGPTSEAVEGSWAIYDPEQTTMVAAGENQGHRLVEYRVVREIVRFGRIGSRLMLPAIPADRGAVLLLQDSAGRILGAADTRDI